MEEEIKVGNIKLEKWQIIAGVGVVFLGVIGFYRNKALKATETTTAAPPVATADQVNDTQSLSNSPGTVETISKMFDDFNTQLSTVNDKLVSDENTITTQNVAITGLQKTVADQNSQLTSKINAVSNQYNSSHANTNSVQSSYLYPNQMFSKGSSGANVSLIQSHLIASGFGVGPTGVDGQFGNYTDSAVRAFQRSKGIAQDGIVGPQTWKALFG